MTRFTLGVLASSFTANMAVKQNAILHQRSYPLASPVIHMSFYVDDKLTGANSIAEAIQMQNDLREIFAHGGFTLHKRRSNE